MLFNFCGVTYATTIEDTATWNGYTVSEPASPAFHFPNYRQELYRLLLSLKEDEGMPYDKAVRDAQKAAQEVILYIRKDR